MTKDANLMTPGKAYVPVGSVMEQHKHGGEGSGNFGHEGRPGEVGGSGPGGGSITVGDKQISVSEDQYIKDAYRESTGKDLEFDGQTGIDVRYYGPDDPMSDYGHAMFVNADKEHRVTGYGDTRYAYDRSTGTDIEDTKAEFIEKWDAEMESGGIFSESGSKYDDVPAEEMWSSVNPDDIVDSAGFWDDGKLMQWYYENIAEPNGIGAINTKDGSIVWDADLIKKVGRSLE